MRNLLKKYSSPIIEEPSVETWNWIAIWGRKFYNIKKVVLQNSRYKLDVTYSNDIIIQFTADMGEFNFKGDYADKKRIDYRIKEYSGSELEKKGMASITISNYNVPEDNIRDYCKWTRKVLRLMIGIHSHGVYIKFNCLEDPSSENAIWLKKHGFYNLFVEAKELLDTLQELLINNSISIDQLKNLMEEGSLDKSEEDREEQQGKMNPLHEKMVQTVKETSGLEEERNTFLGRMKIPQVMTYEEVTRFW